MKISWSFMRAYEKCPLQQKLIRIDKLGPEKVDERRFIRGAIGHKFIELWAKKGFRDGVNPEEARIIFNDLTSKKYIVWLTENDREQTEAQVVRDAAMIIEAVYHHRLNLVNNLKVEEWVSKSILNGAHVITGLLDMVADRQGWIIEMKMSIDPKWSDPGQLLFYGLLLRFAKGQFPKRLSFFLPLAIPIENCLVDIEFSEEDFSKMQGRIISFVNNWESCIFPPKGGKELCAHCDAKIFC